MEMSRHHVVFPTPYGHASPVDVYADVRRTNPVLHQIFVSMPITSAGARRLLQTPAPDRSQMEEVARLNLQIATSLIDAFQALLPTDSLIGSSVGFGLWDGWGESEYLRYWLYHIAGLPVEEALVFEALYQKRVGSQHAAMNDYAKTHAERESFYTNLLALFCSFLERVADLHPVKRLICLPDAAFSLGCRTEIRLARYLGVPIETILLDCTHPGFLQLDCLPMMHQIAQADSDYLLPVFEGDASQLVRFVAMEGRGHAAH
jgi:hypothetical protein